MVRKKNSSGRKQKNKIVHNCTVTRMNFYKTKSCMPFDGLKRNSITKMKQYTYKQTILTKKNKTTIDEYNRLNLSFNF